jgi:hypothetical protein
MSTYSGETENMESSSDEIIEYDSDQDEFGEEPGPHVVDRQHGDSTPEASDSAPCHDTITALPDAVPEISCIPSTSTAKLPKQPISSYRIVSYKHPR